MSGDWRLHPKLKDRFLPDFPDDLQVIVHDGGPRTTRHAPELVWVTVNGVSGDVFQGRVLNQPTSLQTVKQGSEIKFLMPDGCEQPLMVTHKYLRERESWVIHPCSQCGMSELFDAPSDLMRIVFPNLPPDGEVSMFTTFCPLCGGVQGVESKNTSIESADDPETAKTLVTKPWWKFWA